jgi:hypothetical protein
MSFVIQEHISKISGNFIARRRYPYLLDISTTDILTPDALSALRFETYQDAEEYLKQRGIRKYQSVNWDDDTKDKISQGGFKRGETECMVGRGTIEQTYSTTPCGVNIRYYKIIDISEAVANDAKAYAEALLQANDETPDRDYFNIWSKP